MKTTFDLSEGDEVTVEVDGRPVRINLVAIKGAARRPSVSTPLGRCPSCGASC